MNMTPSYFNDSDVEPGLPELPRYYKRLEFIQDKPGLAIPCLVVILVGSLVGTLGNILTITVIATRKHFRNVMCIFMLNLAISDMYVTTIADIMSFIAKIEGEEFFDRRPGLCQTIASGCTISCVGSLMTIGIMSINRFMCLCSPDLYARFFTKRNCICMCVSVYFVGGFLVLLNAAGIGNHGFDRKSIECIWDRMATQSYTIVFSITLVWIPSIMITTCYLRIYLFVRAHSKSMREHDQMGLSTNFRNNFRLAKTLCIIFAVFITCWAPYALILVVDTKDNFPLEAHVIITVFAHIHPSTNWLIYYFTNMRYAAAVQELLCNNQVARSFYVSRTSETQKRPTNSNPGSKTRTFDNHSMQMCSLPAKMALEQSTQIQTSTSLF